MSDTSVQIDEETRNVDLIRPVWRSLIGPPWILGLLFYIAVTAMRCIALLSAHELQYLFFLQVIAMWAIPFLILTDQGRFEIGLTRGIKRFSSVFVSLACGSVAALIFFYLGMLLYAQSADNWCISLRNYLRLDEMTGIFRPRVLFAIFALPAISLTPFGEELLFRGFIFESLARRFNRPVATLVSSLLFACVYLGLHGIWRDPSGFHFHTASAALGVALMALIGAAFMYCRRIADSLWGAIAAHAAFNLSILGLTIFQFAR